MINYNPFNFPGVITPKEKFKISVSVTKKQFEDMKAQGFDTIKMVKGVMGSEMIQSISNLISKQSFKGEIEKEIDSKNLISLIKNLPEKNWYAITNLSTAVIIQDDKDISNEPLNSSFSTNGSLYPIASYNDNKIYVDPMLRWDDTRITFVFNDIIIYDVPENEEIDNVINVVEKEGEATKIESEFTVKLIEPDNKIYKIINVNDLI